MLSSHAASSPRGSVPLACVPDSIHALQELDENDTGAIALLIRSVITAVDYLAPGACDDEESDEEEGAGVPQNGTKGTDSQQAAAAGKVAAPANSTNRGSGSDAVIHAGASVELKDVTVKTDVADLASASKLGDPDNAFVESADI